MTLTSISIPPRERKWTEDFIKIVSWCLTLSTVSIPREDDGAVRFDDIVEEVKAKFDGASQWSITI